MQAERLGFSPEEVRQSLGISRSLVWKLINEGEIRTVRLGRRHIIPKTELNRLMQEE